MERPPSLLTLPMTPQCGQNAPLGQREASMTLRASSSSVKAGLLRSNSGISGLQNSISTLLLWFSQVHNRQRNLWKSLDKNSLDFEKLANKLGASTYIGGLIFAMSDSSWPFALTPAPASAPVRCAAAFPSRPSESPPGTESSAAS